MHVPHQIEVQFAFRNRNALLDCFLEIEGNVEVEFVLEDAVARVEEVFEIVSMFELIARVLVGYMKMRLASVRCEAFCDEAYQLYIK